MEFKNYETIEHVYELLRSSQPFSLWNMPPASEMSFTFKKGGCSYFRAPTKSRPQPRMDISSDHCNTMQQTVETVAHEMIHLFQHVNGLPLAHDNVFNAMADMVCLAHGYARATF